MSRNSLLKAGTKSEVYVTATCLEQATIECGFTAKCVYDMIRTYSQLHRSDKYS